MKVLLDTHAVLWAAEGDARLGSSAQAILETCQAGEAVISDITLLEIAMLSKKGRIKLADPVKVYLRKLQSTYPSATITPEIAARAMDLDMPHGDPFDRVIAATADNHAIPLLTRDANLSKCPAIQTIWF